MDSVFLILLLLSILIAIFGILYRHLRARGLPDIPNQEFIRDFRSLHSVEATSDSILKERRRVGRILGIPPEKLAPGHDCEFLSKRFAYWAEFSVAWNDLLFEAEEAREEVGLEQRKHAPSTIGELLEDTLRAAN